MFLIKELSKSLSCLQVLVREYYSLSKIKDFLFAEVSAYNIEYAIAQHIAIKMTQHSNSLDYQELKAVPANSPEPQATRREKLEAREREQQTQDQHHRPQRKRRGKHI